MTIFFFSQTVFYSLFFLSFRNRLKCFAVVPFIRIFRVHGMLVSDFVKCARNFLLSLNYGRFGMFGFFLSGEDYFIAHCWRPLSRAHAHIHFVNRLECHKLCARCFFLPSCRSCVSIRVNIAKLQNAFQANRALKNTHNMYISSQFICKH